MNPIKNKKDFETTIEVLRKLAYSYLEKYSPSKQQLRTYLLKKVIKKNINITSKKNILTLIDSVIETLVDKQIVSDLHYSEVKAKSYLRKGISSKSLTKF